MKRLLIFICIFILCLIAILFRKHIETFEASPLLVFRVAKSNDKINVNTDIEDIRKKLMGFSWITFNDKFTTPTSVSLEVTDTLSYHLMKRDLIKRAVAVILGNKKHFYMINRGNAEVPERTLREAIDANRRFYASSDSEKFILRAITMASSIHPNKLLWSTKESDADIICKYDYLFVSTSKKNDGTIVAYEDIDIHKLKVMIPFAQTEGVDMSLYYDLSGEKFPVKTCIFFKTILWTRHLGEFKQVEWLSDILSKIGDIDDTNYYTRYFDFLPEVLEVIKVNNRAIIDRHRLPILEQYEDQTEQSITIEASREVKGYYDHKQRTFVPEKQYIDGIPLQIANIIILKNQTRDEENGIYIYRPPFLVKKEEIVESDATQGNMSASKEFVCIGDETIKNKGLCESPLDAMGRPKQIGSWDRPCIKNEECPFYQSNSKYKNYRGGCNNGYCEMPLGISRIGYTKYDKDDNKNKPLCYGCPVENPYCCDRQISPDYAFELDQMERLFNYTNK